MHVSATSSNSILGFKLPLAKVFQLEMYDKDTVFPQEFPSEGVEKVSGTELKPSCET